MTDWAAVAVERGRVIANLRAEVKRLRARDVDREVLLERLRAELRKDPQQ